MEKRNDSFPETPRSFHLRVEETLAGLEEKNMKNAKVYSRRMIAAIAAILIIALATTAVAVVQGNVLRNKMNAGGEQLAAQVQDVHVSDADADFSFSIDEILWEGDNMYASYTVSVPDDGNAYLFSPTQVLLNGKEINNDHGMDAEFFAHLFVLGGGYGTNASQIMQLNVPTEMQGDENNTFQMQCVFLQTDSPIVGLESDAYEALFTEADTCGNEKQMMKNADTLYYRVESAGDDSAPSIYLHPYPEVRAIFESKGMDAVTIRDLESAGIAKLVGTREISIPIAESDGEKVVFNDVAQRVFNMDGYSIEITGLNISHFHTDFSAIIRKEGGEIVEWTDAEPFGQFYDLFNADGSVFGNPGFTIGEGEVRIMEDGEKVYYIGSEGGGVYPVDDVTEIYLAPVAYDGGGEYIGHDMSRAIRIAPIYNPDLPKPTPEPEHDPAETDDISS